MSVIAQRSGALDDRDRRILAALSSVPTPAADLVRAMGEEPSESRKRKVTARLIWLEGIGAAHCDDRSGGRLWSAVTVPNSGGAVAVCDWSGKYGYASEDAALLAMQVIREGIEHGRRRPIRAYKCPRCPWWHLTSKTKETR